MYNYKARIYSPGLGRFMQTDPIGYGDGLNWYNYGSGNTVNRVDGMGTRDGRYPEDTCLYGLTCYSLSFNGGALDIGRS